MILMVWIGVHPTTFLRRMSPSVEQILSVAKRNEGKMYLAAATRNPQPATRAGGGR